VEERIFSHLIEPQRVANMVGLVPGKFGFVSHTSDRSKTAPADGVVSAICVDSVGKGGCPVHEAPLSKTELENPFRLLIRPAWNLVNFGHFSGFLWRIARMHPLQGSAFAGRR
jgi:hypothetical protein